MDSRPSACSDLRRSNLRNNLSAFPSTDRPQNGLSPDIGEARRSGKAHAVVESLLDRPRKRQLVAVRIGQVEEPFSPRRVSWGFRTEPALLQTGPECVNVRDVENEPAPTSFCLTLFQIEDRRLCVLGPKRRKTSGLSTIEKFQAQNVPVEA